MSTARLLETLPAELLTLTVKYALFCASVAGAVVYLEAVAPVMMAPFRYHW